MGSKSLTRKITAVLSDSNFWAVMILLGAIVWFTVKDDLLNRESEDTVLFRKAETYRRANNLGAAEKGFRKLLEQYPDNTAGHIGLGMTFQRQESFSDAIASFNDALSSEKNNDDDKMMILNYIAECQSESGDYEASLKTFAKALELDPKDENSLYNRAAAHRRAIKFDKAVESTKEALEAFPENHRGWTILGAYYMDWQDNLGRSDEEDTKSREIELLDLSVGAFEKALSIEADFPPASRNLNRAKGRLLGLTSDEFKKAKKDVPDAPNADDVQVDEEAIKRAQAAYGQ